jgi:phenylpropionate dioxygenase-like ring-hydroxylating dioxygenase large terminal subunit
VIDLLGSDDVPTGRVVAVEAGGLELVVWRTFGGLACVTDAMCPHLLSSLSVDGVVDDDELVCAAHGWRFTRRGTGWLVDSGGRRTPVDDLCVYPSEERDGRILADLP